ncbi:cupin domain-containing protein [uncultured Lacinutrix sp.]|uniref:cupin domain-containing protein n=1 Tax=uncultured Lacinutrix sp. TaxID=574032 RepID=UPI002602A6AD|nr:cupin domain-containing protein [uncultured Lacinutrix sp.]
MNIKTITIIWLLFLSSEIINAQNKLLEPILLDKSTLSGVGLKKVNLKDEPEKDFYQKQLYKGEDISVYVVSTETWNNNFKNFWFDEFIYMYHGEAVIKPKKGKVQLFHSNDYFFAPKGYTGEWEIKAGNNLHYELSVITTKRADSSFISENLEHKLFKKSTLSGAHIKLDNDGKYIETLRKGIELTVSLKAEKPSQWKIKQAKEMLIQILSGQVTIKNLEGIEKTFYSGDFFIIPKDLSGNWKSEGHGLVKYLAIEKTLIE